MASREDMEDRDVDEAEARGESKGDAAAVEGTESTVVVLRMAEWPLDGTAVEDILTACTSGMRGCCCRIEKAQKGGRTLV